MEKDIILTADLKHKKHKKNNNSSEIVQWNLDALGIKNAEEDSEKIKIAIIDSGISFSSEFAVSESKNFVESDLNENPLFEDTSGHGTAMGGIIGSNGDEYGIKGINPNAIIYSAKVLDSNNQSPLSRIIEGIYWAIDNDVDIINMSFGTNIDSEILHNAVKMAHRAGIVLVASSGNNANSDVKYPAKYDEVIGVGALGVNGQIWEDTSRGEGLDLLAPGQKIETTGVFTGMLSTCGTSIAAAQVSGVASLLLQKDKTKSPDFIKDLLKASAKMVEYDKGTVGLPDYSYACEIYDDFANIYLKNTSNEIPINTIEITDFSEETSDIVEGMWGNSGHGNLVNIGVNEISIDTKYINIMNYACTHIDEYYGAVGNKTSGVDRTKINHKVQALHGRGNYVANIRFISNFAQYMGEGTKTVDQIIEKCEEKFPTLITYDESEGKYIDATTKRSMADKYYETDGYIMLDLARALKEMYINLTKSGSKKTLYNAQAQLVKKGESGSATINPIIRMYVFLGVALHAMGDVYSHRTIVPNYTVTYDNFPTIPVTNTTYFDKFGAMDFNTTSPTITGLLLSQLRAYVYRTNPFQGYNDEYRYKEYLKATVETNVVEFQDVVRFEKSEDNTRYDDMATFCKERYTDAGKCCKRYLEKIITTNGTNFKKIEKFYVKYIFPKDNHVKLNNLKNYAIDAGLNTTAQSESEWNTHSTTNYV